ncbi:MAG: hypothetical protein RhofKO_43010 [Rhodothermales bacterium]
MVEVNRYVARFIDEAEERGFSLRDSVEALTIHVEPYLVFEGRQFCGYVPVDEERDVYTRDLYIGTNPTCWTRRSAEEREALVFHELGHAILDRFHTDTRLPNGDLASIMATATTDFDKLYDDDTRFKRDYYVDELFDPSTPVPDWAVASANR